MEKKNKRESSPYPQTWWLERRGRGKENKVDASVGGAGGRGASRAEPGASLTGRGRTDSPVTTQRPPPPPALMQRHPHHAYTNMHRPRAPS